MQIAMMTAPRAATLTPAAWALVSVVELVRETVAAAAVGEDE